MVLVWFSQCCRKPQDNWDHNIPSCHLRLFHTPISLASLCWKFGQNWFLWGTKGSPSEASRVSICSRVCLRIWMGRYKVSQPEVWCGSCSIPPSCPGMGHQPWGSLKHIKPQHNTLEFQIEDTAQNKLWKSFKEIKEVLGSMRKGKTHKENFNSIYRHQKLAGVAIWISILLSRSK